MEPLTTDDVRRWDLGAIRQVFDVATERGRTMHRLGDNLQQVHDNLSDWHGAGGEAFRQELGKVRQDIDEHGQESARVAAAVSRAEKDISACKTALADIDDTARRNNWKITPDWKVDIGNTGQGRARDLQFVTAWQTMQQDLDKLKVRAQAADQELATALRGAVGDIKLDANGFPLPQDPAPPPPPGVTAEQLHEIFPTLPMADCEKYAGPLSDAMREAGMTSPEARAAFLATFAVESGELRYWSELRSEAECTKMYGPEYAGTTFPPGTLDGVGGSYTNVSGQLGNTQPGDGYRYRGRGPIQLTGRHNYEAAGQALGVDLVTNPDLVASPEYGFKVATWFWNNHPATLPDGSVVPLNQAAESGNFAAVTRAINGGLTGYDDRLAYFNKAISVLSR
jgi:predicted chitinase/uncharacterized protein YukE